MVAPPDAAGAAVAAPPDDPTPMQIDSGPRGGHEQVPAARDEASPMAAPAPSTPRAVAAGTASPAVRPAQPTTGAIRSSS
eukprot:10186835-Alexandrium_andersonii.AAC.1